MSDPASRSTHKFLRDRIIFIGLPIDDELAADVLDALRQLEQKANTPIMIYLNSPGGAVDASEKIMRAMDACVSEVHTLCLGLAAGTAAHIFLTGRRRFAKASARVAFAPFRANDHADASDIESIRRRFVARTKTAIGVSEEVIERWMTEGTYFSGPDLVRLGIAHQVI